LSPAFNNHPKTKYTPVGFTPELNPSGGARAMIVAASGTAALFKPFKLKIGKDKAGLAARVATERTNENFISTTLESLRLLLSGLNMQNVLDSKWICEVAGIPEVEKE
jgi:hypothetical protein